MTGSGMEGFGWSTRSRLSDVGAAPAGARFHAPLTNILAAEALLSIRERSGEGPGGAGEQEEAGIFRVGAGGDVPGTRSARVRLSGAQLIGEVEEDLGRDKAAAGTIRRQMRKQW